jgi:hypothetical protein
MISHYLEIHFFICTYVLIIGAMGYISHSLFTIVENLLCPTPRPVVYYQPPYLPLHLPRAPTNEQNVWTHIGSYNAAPTISVPLFYNEHATPAYFYFYKGAIVHPSNAAVHRRYRPLQQQE